ncbi:MAG: NAD-dependent epimerase/dehydratase family protein, partial [Chloroflexi bacterium]
MILVAGGTGHLGIELVPLLTARGIPVRVVTRDPDRARQRLGATPQLAKGDARNPH